MWTPKLGPDNPNLTDFHKAKKNTLTGYVEPASLSEFQFESQRRTFHTCGYAIDPTSSAAGDKIIGNSSQALQNNGEKIYFLENKPDRIFIWHSMMLIIQKTQYLLTCS